MKASGVIVTTLSILALIGVGYMVYKNYIVGGRESAIKYLAIEQGHPADFFKGFGDEYLIEWAKAMKKKEPYFMVKDSTKHFSTETGKVIK